jgi:hypothetical protein
LIALRVAGGLDEDKEVFDLGFGNNFGLLAWFGAGQFEITKEAAN